MSQMGIQGADLVFACPSPCDKGTEFGEFASGRLACLPPYETGGTGGC